LSKDKPEAIKRDDLHAALIRLAGTPRTLLYDIAEDEAPERTSPATPFVQGSDAWWRFVGHRRRLDDGNGLNLVISLRGLRTEERLLAINWGTAFSNSFLLIEPADPWLDLTTPEGLAEFAASSGATDGESLVRAAYAEWNYWIRDERGELESRSATLNLEEAATVADTMMERLPKAFPAASFLATLTLLNLRESELFTGRPAGRAIMPFLTRLGLPVVYDPRYVVNSVRQLVNAGLARVQDPDDNWRVYRGPAQPIPAEISDERVSRMMR
jgi:hypothetical protein